MGEKIVLVMMIEEAVAYLVAAARKRTAKVVENCIFV